DRSATPPKARPSGRRSYKKQRRGVNLGAAFRGGISRRICSTQALKNTSRSQERTLMSRFPEITPNAYSDEQSELAERVAGSRGAMRGPFVPALHSPGILRAIEATGAYVRFENSLPEDLKELATITVGRFWGAQYEWYAHANLALKAGVAPAIVEAIRKGEAPKSMT